MIFDINSKVMPQSFHISSSNLEFNKLKDLITALTNGKKLKLNDYSELELKNRNIFKADNYNKTQKTVSHVVRRLLKLSIQDIPAKDLQPLVNILKTNEWSAEALKNDPVKKNFMLLENYLKTKISLSELNEIYEKYDREYYAEDSSASSDDFDSLDELAATFKNKRMLYDNQNAIIHDLFKSQTTPNSSSNSLRGGKG